MKGRHEQGTAGGEGRITCVYWFTGLLVYWFTGLQTAGACFIFKYAVRTVICCHPGLET